MAAALAAALLPLPALGADRAAHCRDCPAAFTVGIDRSASGSRLGLRRYARRPRDAIRQNAPARIADPASRRHLRRHAAIRHARRHPPLDDATRHSHSARYAASTSRARPAASRSGDAAKRGAIRRAVAPASQIAAAVTARATYASVSVGYPVVQPDRMQDGGAEPPDRRPPCERHHRHALPQRLDRRGAGVVRERIERDVDLAVRRPGAWLRRGVDQLQPFGADAERGEARPHEFARRPAR